MNSPFFSGLRTPGKIRNPFNLSLILALWFLVLPGQLFAYIDPGTGSYVFQMIIATLVGSMFLLKTSWQRLKDWFSQLFSAKKKSENEEKKDD